MAEVDTGGGGGGKHKGAPKQKKKSTRIDMTAMVDVAFLLLTFFILTTTLATPQALELIKPPKLDNPEDQLEVAESKVMTIILGEKDKVYYYLGVTEPKVLTTDFSAEGVRKEIVNHLNRFPNRCPKGATADDIKKSRCWDPIIVLKPNKSCRYKNMVDILDEMRINKVLKYALAEVTPQDSILLLDNNLK
ncbi:MAG: biopolymer transporter ExbD [Bacteroidia bacterium]